ncbi:hypothetical protein [uncultured Jannaschia sp.]|nr:hypothetical protein [uncultured Jannaschia sp.]
MEVDLRPTMLCVESKAQDQQARALVFRTCEQIVNQRTKMAPGI